MSFLEIITLSAMGLVIGTTQTMEVVQADPPTQQLTAEEITAQVQLFYDSIETFHADFQQTYSNIALNDEMVSTGRVYFRKPGRMLWDYQTPQERYLISNGTTLWAYEPEFDQYAELPLGEHDLPTAIRFLMGEGDLLEDFDITSIDCEGERHCLHLIPKVGAGQYQSLEFFVDPESFQVVETTIIDPVGNRNHFTFSNTVVNDDLPEENFEFRPTSDMRRINP